MKEIRSYSRVLVELPEPAFSKLEKLARARRRTVADLVEEVITGTGLVDALAPPLKKRSEIHSLRREKGKAALH